MPPTRQGRARVPPRQADGVELNLTGLGGATVHARNAARLTLSGMASATVYGKPATHGMGGVSWQ